MRQAEQKSCFYLFLKRQLSVRSTHHTSQHSDHQQREHSVKDPLAKFMETNKNHFYEDERRVFLA